MLSPRGARGVEKLNSTGTLIQKTTTEAPQETHVLHRTRCSQENDQLLRQGCERADLSRWQDQCNTTGTGHLDKDSPTALDGRDGSNDLHRLDLRSSAAVCQADQSGAPTDAACHCSSQKEERPDRCRQDR